MLLALVMIFALAACGQQAAPAAEKPAEAPAAEAPAAEAPAAEAPAAVATGSLKIWVPEATVEFTKAQVAAFMEANPEYAGYEVSVEPVGEGDAASNMLTDVEAGADIFNFAQDQLARLVSAGALIELSDENAAIVAAENDAGSVAAATMGGTVYAYPLTSDNGYFMYYDKSVVSDPSTLEGILADCEAIIKAVDKAVPQIYIEARFIMPKTIAGTAAREVDLIAVWNGGNELDCGKITVLPFYYTKGLRIGIGSSSKSTYPDFNAENAFILLDEGIVISTDTWYNTPVDPFAKSGNNTVTAAGGTVNGTEEQYYSVPPYLFAGSNIGNTPCEKS